MRMSGYIAEYERGSMSDAPDPLGGSDPDPVSAPGTGEHVVDPEVLPSSDGTQNTEQASDTPTTIPYSRFTEVNTARKTAEEALAPFRELEQLGYDAAELQRLAQWETEFSADPVTAWLATAKDIPNLPQGVLEAITAHSGEPVTPSATPLTPVEPELKPADGEEVPSWAQHLLDREAAREQAEKEAALQAEAEAARATGKAHLDGITEAWKKMDAKDKIMTPDQTMLAHIIAASHHSEDPSQILALARADYLKGREEILSDTIQPSGLKLKPVPGGGTGITPRSPVPVPRTLTQASKHAQAALVAGELPVE